MEIRQTHPGGSSVREDDPLGDAKYSASLELDVSNSHLQLPAPHSNLDLEQKTPEGVIRTNTFLLFINCPALQMAFVTVTIVVCSLNRKAALISA